MEAEYDLSEMKCFANPYASKLKKLTHIPVGEGVENYSSKIQNPMDETTTNGIEKSNAELYV